jgi:hypothetical protein
MRKCICFFISWGVWEILKPYISFKWPCSPSVLVHHGFGCAWYQEHCPSCFPLPSGNRSHTESNTILHLKLKGSQSAAAYYIPCKKSREDSQSLEHCQLELSFKFTKARSRLGPIVWDRAPVSESSNVLSLTVLCSLFTLSSNLCCSEHLNHRTPC